MVLPFNGYFSVIRNDVADEHLETKPLVICTSSEKKQDTKTCIFDSVIRKKMTEQKKDWKDMHENIKNHSLLIRVQWVIFNSFFVLI